MANMRRAGASTRDFVGEMDKAGKAGQLDTVADGVGAVGLGLVGMAGYAVKSAMDFEKSMSKIEAATHAGTAEMGQLREAALQAGKDTQYSATGAADAITELSKAGVSTADVLGGGLKGALSLAAAGQLDVAEAAETAASAMTQFKLKGKDIPHIADLLAAAAGKAQGSVHDMGMALNMAGLVAAQTGLTIEETTGGLAAFANAGLIGSDAGTSFKQMLMMLQAPSDKSKALMDELGISLYDAQGQFIGLTRFAGQLQTALKDLTPAARAAAMAQIFGSDATRAASVMYEQGAAGIQKWIDKVNDAGYAQETAALLTDNLAGDLERLKGEIETLAIQAGSASNGGLRLLVQSVEALVSGIGSLPPFVTSTVTVLAGVGGAAALLAAGWVKGRRATAEFRAELEAVGPGGERASRGLQKVTSAATKATLVFAGLQAAGALINQFQDDLKPQVEAMAKGLERYAAGGQLAGEASRVLGKDLEDLKIGFAFLADGDNNRRQAVKHMQDALEGLVPGLDGTNTSLAKTRERITAMDAALSQLTSSGNATTANEIFQKLAAELATGGVTMAEFRKQFPQYAAALEVAGKATADQTGKTQGLTSAAKDATDKQEEFKSATEAATAAAKGQRDALSQLANFMKSETDPVFGLVEAQEKLAEAQRKTSEAARKHGRSSAEAKAATRELALAAIDLQNKVGALGGTFDGKMTPTLKDTLRAAGLTERQVRDLERQFLDAKKAADQYDGKYEARASAPGAKQAKADLDKAYTAANGFAGPYVARLMITGDKAVNDKLAELLIKQRALSTGLSYSASKAAVQKDLDRNRQRAYAEGGWTGPGHKYEPAGIVHADEYVINKAARQSIERRHPGMLDEMNATGQLPGYAAGGRVWRFPTNVSRTDIPTLAEVLAKAIGDFGRWPSSPGAQRGDSGVWRKIMGIVKASGIPYQFGNAYRPGDPKWHGSGRAIDFMGYNQDRLAQLFLSRQSQVLELIHRTNSRDYGITRGRYNAMPTQWPLHRNHLHVAMAGGGTITEPVMGVGASGATYSFGENWRPERVTPNWQGAGAGQVVLAPVFTGPVGSQAELEGWLSASIDNLRRKGKI